MYERERVCAKPYFIPWQYPAPLYSMLTKDIKHFKTPSGDQMLANLLKRYGKKYKMAVDPSSTV
jgi:hypothetical protein